MCLKARFWARFYSYSILTIYLSALIFLILECMLTIPAKIEIDDYLNKDLKSVNTWLSSNKLTLNLTKTEFLIITSRQRRVYLSDNPSLTINNFPIEQVSSTKSLGVSIDENLNWNTHIQTVCKNISSALGLIKSIRDFVPFYTLLNIFNGLVKPQFDYCSLV